VRADLPRATAEADDWSIAKSIVREWLTDKGVALTGVNGEVSRSSIHRFKLDLEQRIVRAIADVRLTRPRAATGDTAWLPIERAPKGRKLIVGYWNPLGNWRSVMGCYYLDGTLESETDESGFAPEGWYEETEAYEYLMPMGQEPTHYQPLSAPPPKPKEKESRG
jgi:hypothetical protein